MRAAGTAYLCGSKDLVARANALTDHALELYAKSIEEKAQRTKAHKEAKAADPTFKPTKAKGVRREGSAGLYFSVSRCDFALRYYTSHGATLLNKKPRKRAGEEAVADAGEERAADAGEESKTAKKATQVVVAHVSQDAAVVLAAYVQSVLDLIAWYSSASAMKASRMQVQSRDLMLGCEVEAAGTLGALLQHHRITVVDAGVVPWIPEGYRKTEEQIARNMKQREKNAEIRAKKAAEKRAEILAAGGTVEDEAKKAARRSRAPGEAAMEDIQIQQAQTGAVMAINPFEKGVRALAGSSEATPRFSSEVFKYLQAHVEERLVAVYRAAVSIAQSSKVEAITQDHIRLAWTLVFPGRELPPARHIKDVAAAIAAGTKAAAEARERLTAVRKARKDAGDAAMATVAPLPKLDLSGYAKDDKAGRKAARDAHAAAVEQYRVFRKSHEDAAGALDPADVALDEADKAARAKLFTNQSNVTNLSKRAGVKRRAQGFYDITECCIQAVVEPVVATAVSLTLNHGALTVGVDEILLAIHKANGMTLVGDFKKVAKRKGGKKKDDGASAATGTDIAVEADAVADEADADADALAPISEAAAPGPAATLAPATVATLSPAPVATLAPAAPAPAASLAPTLAPAASLGAPSMGAPAL